MYLTDKLNIECVSCENEEWAFMVHEDGTEEFVCECGKAFLFDKENNIIKI